VPAHVVRKARGTNGAACSWRIRPGYDANATARHPALYLPDGGIDEDLVDAVHFGCTWDLLRPLFVVGIENTKRRRDLTEPTEIETERAAPCAGGATRDDPCFRLELGQRRVESREHAAVTDADVGKLVQAIHDRVLRYPRG
jgi:hypothetical protein